MNDSDRRQSRRRSLLAAFFVLVAGVLLLFNWEKPHPGDIDLPEFPSGDVAARKAAFFEFLRPIVRHLNERLRDERAFLLSLEGRDDLDRRELRLLEELAARYEVDLASMERNDALALLKLRVDVIPAALVLAQAAKESGWGRSRFAREGNALFGEWCFEPGCGIVPARRAKHRQHEVRSFDTVHDAVASYMNNINTHRSYRDLRLARAGMRDDGEKLSALALADHLLRYSERGAPYVREIRALIRNNGLESDKQ